MATWLTDRERGQVEAAAGPRLAFSHRPGLAAVGGDLAAGGADAVLVSAALLTPADAEIVAQLVRGFPAVATAGLLTGAAGGARAVAAAHLLGQAGVPTLFDCREGAGWGALRAAFSPRHLPDAFLRGCVGSVLADVGGVGAPDGLVRFFAAAFAPDVARADDVAARLGVAPSTLMSRFHRAGLPSPKRYVAWARLVWAARLGEQPGLTLTDVAHGVRASSPQTFHRTVRALTGRPAAEFRRTTDGAAMLAHYRAVLVAPYRAVLVAFDPLGAQRRWVGRGAERPATAFGRAA